MPKLNQATLRAFASKKIVEFHDARLARLQKINLHSVLKKKNPYLFRAKNLLTANDLIENILNAFISSSEEELFGQFLEELAIFISQQTCGGKKASTTGIDLEFEREGVRYAVAVKSGPAWGNSSQYAALEKNFRNILTVLRQSSSNNNVQAVLGICYGKSKTTDKGLYFKITGQNFWYFLSGNEDLYTQIIEPIGHEASRHFESYVEQRNMLYNRFAREFLIEFCDAHGAIEWKRLVQFNSGNTKKNSWNS